MPSAQLNAHKNRSVDECIRSVSCRPRLARLAGGLIRPPILLPHMRIWPMTPARDSGHFLLHSRLGRGTEEFTTLLGCWVMKPSRSFASDNNATVHPEIMEAIGR